MKQNLRTKLVAAALAGALILPAAASLAADNNAGNSNPSVSVTADKLEYNGKTQVAKATGNVVIVRDQATLTGDVATYNLKTAEADIQGNVTAQQPDMHMTSETLHSTNQNYLVATGNVKGVYGDKKVNGDKVEYYLDKDHGIVTGHGYLEAQGSQMWADHIDGWFKEIRAVGTGNVHIESPADGLTAYGNKAVYTQTPGQQNGIIHMTGNVYATQNGNQLSGNDVEVHLADNSVQSNGRSTVVFIPGSEEQGK